jgi:xylan 1,4-beta-xylosidase
MYDVFVDAVTSVDPKLRVGGPACYHEYFLKPFLEHVTNGTNYLTGEKGTRIDFISYHIYGLSGSWLKNEPHIQPMVQYFAQSVLWLQRLLKEFPDLKGVEFHINEWGMASNYYRTVKDYPDLEYRNSEESALFLVKLVNSLYQIEDNNKFPTSLLLYWGFSWEADEDEFFVGKRELTTAGNTPKPIQTGFEILAKLEDQRLQVQREQKDNRLGVLATKSPSGQISLIAYNYVEDEKELNKSDELVLNFNGLQPNTSYQFIETSLDRTNNNTYTTWKAMGEPASSVGLNLSPLQRAGQLTPTGKGDFMTNAKGEGQLKLNLQRHSMRLVQLNEK